jgi:hypothetical protein
MPAFHHVAVPLAVAIIVPAWVLELSGLRWPRLALVAATVLPNVWLTLMGHDSTNYLWCRCWSHGSLSRVRRKSGHARWRCSRSGSACLASCTTLSLQSPYGISLYAEAAGRALTDGDSEPVATNLQDIRETTREALGEMRLLLFERAGPCSTGQPRAGAAADCDLCRKAACRPNF